jgi:signal transduction histidine kinase
MDTTEFLQLLRKMGHDMRVPLNTIISTGDMLEQGVYDPLTAKQAKAVTRLQRNNHRILAILDDFMTYMKADAGELRVVPMPFDPRTRLAEWCDPVRSTANEKGVLLEITTSKIVPPTLIGDEALLGRIVQALLWNAIAYTAQGRVCITSTWTENQEWLLTVQDTGGGISTDDLPHIFEPFWRGEARPQTPTAGAGLGLPMSLALAKVMKGQLILKETSAGGSTFSLEVPSET